MSMTRVKICGLTNLADALVAAEAGADYLGFIFYPASKRAVTVADVQPIAAALRARPDCPRLVGVFVNAPAATMVETLTACRLDYVQLSGDEVPQLVGDRASPLYGRAFKALRPQSLAEAEADAEWYGVPQPVDALLPTLLLDAWHPALYGGTGQTGDWAIAARLAAQLPRLMLAGGLTPHNVGEAIRQVRPFAVDVAGGVEAAPGRKDHAALRAFVQQAQTALSVAAK